MTTQHERARLWRVNRKLSVKELADASGYSIEAIYAFERGKTPKRTYKKGSHAPPVAVGPYQEWVWLRYKNACRGVEHGIRTGKEWDWA